MLALSRGEGQSIIIDGKIEVKIVKWSRSSVRLAIQAPREITVDRDEIWRKMHPGEMSPLEKAEQDRREKFGGPGGPGAPGGPAGPGPSKPAGGGVTGSGPAGPQAKGPAGAGDGEEKGSEEEDGEGHA